MVQDETAVTVKDGAVDFRRAAFAAAGVLLIGVAVFLGDGAIERALVSDPARDLAWGPGLFRALLAAHGIALILAVAGWRKLVGGADSQAGRLPAAESSSLKIDRTHFWVLVGLSVVGLALRMVSLDTDLWHDEVGTLLDYVRPPLGDIVTSFPNQNQHMLYSILAHISIGTFGESAWALRLPSVVFGVASLWALFLLGRRAMGGREALLACSLMTVSYHHIWFSQNARGYMGLLFLATLGTWVWLEALARNRWPWWLAYAAVAALGMFMHLTMAFVVAAHGVLHLVLLARPRWGAAPAGWAGLESRAGWKPFAAWVLALTFTLQLYALSLPEFLRAGLHEVSLPSEWTNPLWVLAEGLRNLRLGFAGAAVVIVGAALVSAGWLGMLRRNVRTGVLMVLPALLAGSTMLALGHNLWPRFFFFSMGFALLITVNGAVIAPRFFLNRFAVSRGREGLATAAGTVLTCLLIGASVMTLPRNYSLPKQDFTGARDYVERRRVPGDAVVAVGLAGTDYGRYFAPHWSVPRTAAELEAIRSGRSSVWLVYTLPIQVKAWHPEIWSVIESDFEVVEVFSGTLGDGEVYVCRQREDRFGVRLPGKAPAELFIENRRVMTATRTTTERLRGKAEIGSDR